MIRNMLCLFILTFCLFALTFSTEPSNSEGGLSARADFDGWATLFNNFQEFYDGHDVKVVFRATDEYGGWYDSSISVSMNVNGTKLTDSNGSNDYYSNGVVVMVDADVDADSVDNPPPNIDLPGSGSVWGRIFGSTIEDPNSKEVYVDETKWLQDSSDITPNCGACTDANANCVNANNRHFGP
ncbi:hypothetical protein J4G08_09155 [Candidatus Poribacteria bacterium]|nr:hypothetical protein [Candidatus Poribacteria bacterium]